MRSARGDRTSTPLTLFLYRVTAPGWSLPLGQCATCFFWLAHIRMQLPWKMSSWSKWAPLLPSLSFQAELVCCFGGKHAMLLCPCMWTCVRTTDARAHTCMASQILEARERGYFIFFFFFYRESRTFYCAVMCVGAYMSMCTHGSSASVCAVHLHGSSKTAFWYDTNQNVPLIFSGSQASWGTFLFTSIWQRERKLNIKLVCSEIHSDL